MANNRNAFKRLLSTVPKVDGESFRNCEELVEYYAKFERQFQSEIFLNKDLLGKLQKVARDQKSYDLGFIKIKRIAELVDELYEVKYG
jgi:hypothetical protein